MNDQPMTRHRSQSWTPAAGLCLAALLVLGCLVHLAALRLHADCLDPDEAVVALMGKHILEGRSLPVFYYGQPYLGSLEAYGVALAFRLVGQQPAAARLVSLAASLVLLVLVFLLARPLGTAQAAAASLAVALPPPYVLVWHLKIRGGFMLAAVLTALLIGAAERVLGGRRRPRDLVLLGLISGLACWTNQLLIPFTLAALALVFLRLQNESGSARRSGLLLALGSLAGAAPLVVYNLVHPARTFLHLGAHYLNLELDGRPPLDSLRLGLYHSLARSLPSNMHQLIWDTAPRLVGGASWDPPWALLPALGLGLTVLVAGLAGWRSRRSPRAADAEAAESKDLRRLLLLLLLLGLVVRRNAQLNQFLHLIGLLPLTALALAPRGRRVLVACAVALLAVPGMVENLTGLLQRRLPLPQPAPHRLVAWLDSQAVRAVYTEHRPAYLIAWFSQERIAASPLADFDWTLDRWPAYSRRVGADPSPAWVFEQRSANAQRFESRCRMLGGRWRRTELGRYLIYDHVTCPTRELLAADRRDREPRPPP
jgi:hypothetical protein